MLDFGQIWMALQQGAANPEMTPAVADQLAAAGDPNMMAPLFSDTAEWSPTDFGQVFKDASLANSGGQSAGYAGLGEARLAPQPQFAGQPTPSINPGSNPSAPAAPQAAAAPQLTADQAKELFGMAQQQPQRPLPPPSAIGRPQAFNANMGALQAAPVAQQARPTLAQLIYGRR